MSKNEPISPNAPRKQSIEELQRRFKQLDEARIAAEANRKTAQARVDELKASAKAQYGSDDIEVLQEQLEEMIAENERKRSAYQTTLDAIEGDLAEVERSFAEAEKKRANSAGDESGERS